MADHREQRAILRDTIDDPIGVEDLMSAMFRVRLREHHQFHVAGVAFQTDEAVEQIVDFILRQRQSSSRLATIRASRPPPSRSTLANGAGSAWANSKAGSSSGSNTASVMRSCSNGFRSACSPAVNARVN